jgi:membrane protease YdiL (CAAX protease family)
MAEQGTDRPSRRAVLVEVLGAFVVATAVVAGLYRLRGVPLIERNLAVVAAVGFLYLPALLLWRRGRDLDQYGLRVRPLGRGLLWFLGCAALIVPLFSLGYYAWLRLGCLHLPRWLAHCPPLGTPAVRWPPQLGLLLLSQLLVVALPEEFFFRGFIQGRLREVFSAPAAWLGQAVLFALGHYLVTFDPAALAVFFPGLLFGLLRAQTGSVLAGTLLHALCNLLIDVLHRSLV